MEDIVAKDGVEYHQYAGDTQLLLAMRANNNTAAGLSMLLGVPLTSDCGICN